MSRSEEFRVGYVSARELSQMYANDFDVPMSEAMTALDAEHSARLRESDPEEYLHPKDMEHGSPRAYIDHLKADISRNGMTNPIDVWHGHVVHDGHHRGIAAMELGMERIPVRYL